MSLKPKSIEINCGNCGKKLNKIHKDIDKDDDITDLKTSKKWDALCNHCGYTAIANK